MCSVAALTAWIRPAAYWCRRACRPAPVPNRRPARGCSRSRDADEFSAQQICDDVSSIGQLD
eukprot:6189025-Pleurochrysis_carterae.AAC.1